MSDTQQDPSWWKASDGKWYPPQSATPPPPPSATPPPIPPPPQPFAAPQAFGAQPAYTPAGGAGLPSVNGMAVASMVLGIVSLVFCWCWPVGGTCAIVGLPLGAVAFSRIKNGQADPRPRGMAIAGIVMCIISIALIVIILVAVAGSDTTFDSNFD